MPTKKVTKPSAKTTPAKKSENTTPMTTTPSTIQTTSNKSSFKVKKSYIILVLIIVLVGGLLFYFRSWFVAATVNGQPISRVSVIHETEKQSGKQALNTLVRNTLIEQEAAKEHITVSDQEINDELKKVETQLGKQGQKIDQVLAMQGMTKDDLRQLIRLDKLVGKMVGKDITITDKQVTDYMDKNKESLPQGQSEDKLKAMVKDQLKQQSLNQKVSAWLQQLQSKAKINYFVSY